MFTHHELPQDEVRRRQQAAQIDRIQRMLQSITDDALRAALLDELDAAAIEIIPDEGAEVA